MAVYIIWEFLALGIISVEGEHGIIEGYAKGTNGAHLLTAILGHSFVGMIARLFSFFAIVTPPLVHSAGMDARQVRADGLFGGRLAARLRLYAVHWRRSTSDVYNL